MSGDKRNDIISTGERLALHCPELLQTIYRHPERWSLPARAAAMCLPWQTCSTQAQWSKLLDQLDRAIEKVRTSAPGARASNVIRFDENVAKRRARERARVTRSTEERPEGAS